MGELRTRTGTRYESVVRRQSARARPRTRTRAPDHGRRPALQRARRHARSLVVAGLLAVRGITADFTADLFNRALDARAKGAHVFTLFATHRRAEGHDDVVASFGRRVHVDRGFGVLGTLEHSRLVDVSGNDRGPGALGEIRGATLELLEMAVGRATALGVDHEVPLVFDQFQR